MPHAGFSSSVRTEPCACDSGVLPWRRGRIYRSTARTRTGSSRARAEGAGAGLCTCLFDEVHEPGPEAPGLVAVALQGADGQLGRSLGRHGHHVHGIVHQRCFCLHRHSPVNACKQPLPRAALSSSKPSSTQEFQSVFSTGRETAPRRQSSGGLRQAGEGF